MYLKYLLAIGMSAVALNAQAAHLNNPNLLVDPGFEGTLTFDGSPFIGLWEGFSAGGSSSAAFTTNMPRTGEQSLELDISGGANEFAGAFQDAFVDPSLAGNMWWYSGWHKLDGEAGGTEIRVEWRNSVSNTEISRSPNLAVSPSGSGYEEFVLSDTVPAGADTVRVVYAIQSFGGSTDQTVYLDDVNFNVAGAPVASVPDGGSTGLALASVLALGVVARRWFRQGEC